MPFEDLKTQIRACQICTFSDNIEPRPMVFGNEKARILIAGQAPSRTVYNTGLSWNDKSGDKLREWLGVSRAEFYDEDRFALIPAGLCYPGYSGKGDNPPKKICAPTWHGKIMAGLPNLRLKLIIGQYSIAYHMKYFDIKGKNLTQIVRNWRNYGTTIPLVHPSPRNYNWLKTNPWFEKELVPYLQETVRKALL